MKMLAIIFTQNLTVKQKKPQHLSLNTDGSLVAFGKILKLEFGKGLQKTQVSGQILPIHVTLLLSLKNTFAIFTEWFE